MKAGARTAAGSPTAEGSRRRASGPPSTGLAQGHDRHAVAALVPGCGVERGHVGAAGEVLADGLAEGTRPFAVQDLQARRARRDGLVHEPHHLGHGLLDALPAHVDPRADAHDREGGVALGLRRFDLDALRARAAHLREPAQPGPRLHRAEGHERLPRADLDDLARGRAVVEADLVAGLDRAARGRRGALGAGRPDALLGAALDVLLPPPDRLARLLQPRARGFRRLALGLGLADLADGEFDGGVRLLDDLLGLGEGLGAEPVAVGAEAVEALLVVGLEALGLGGAALGLGQPLGRLLRARLKVVDEVFECRLALA